MNNRTTASFHLSRLSVMFNLLSNKFQTIYSAIIACSNSRHLVRSSACFLLFFLFFLCYLFLRLVIESHLSFDFGKLTTTTTTNAYYYSLYYNNNNNGAKDYGEKKRVFLFSISSERKKQKRVVSLTVTGVCLCVCV